MPIYCLVSDAVLTWLRWDIEQNALPILRHLITDVISSKNCAICEAAYDRSWHNVWSGRASQEVFVDPVVAVLHQSVRPLTGARLAPGHHGHQRARDLIRV